jgi:hypothetical protein
MTGGPLSNLETKPETRTSRRLLAMTASIFFLFEDSGNSSDQKRVQVPGKPERRCSNTGLFSHLEEKGVFARCKNRPVAGLVEMISKAEHMSFAAADEFHRIDE